MAANESVPNSRNPHNSTTELIVPRHGVVTFSAMASRSAWIGGHLVLHDGIGPDRRYARLAARRSRPKRLVVIGSDGMVSLAALRWLADQDVAFSMLERDGKVLAVTGPVRPSDAKLRRAQALAHSSGAALRITRELISRKLAGQEQVARDKLLDSTTADAIARFRAEVPTGDSITTIRLDRVTGCPSVLVGVEHSTHQLPEESITSSSGALAQLRSARLAADGITPARRQSAECNSQLPLCSA